MVRNLYSIYDCVAKVFNKPFPEHNDDSAKRSFLKAIEEVPTGEKSEYSLYFLCSYDDSNGTVHSNSEPVKICSGFDK